MPKITALIHCHASGQQLARSLETLHACDEVLIINHDADEETEKVSRQHGAKVKVGVPGVSRGTYLVDASNDWILCLKPTESIGDDLAASLLEWKQQDHDNSATFAMSVRSQQEGQWKNGSRHTRLVNRTHVNWTGELPPDREDSDLMQGDLLEFDMPSEKAAPTEKAS